jgi:hypothetical protein
MEAVRTSETSVNIYLTTRQYIPENSKRHTRRSENLKSHQFQFDLRSSCDQERLGSDRPNTLLAMEISGFIQLSELLILVRSLYISSTDLYLIKVYHIWICRTGFKSRHPAPNLIEIRRRVQMKNKEPNNNYRDRRLLLLTAPINTCSDE